MAGYLGVFAVGWLVDFLLLMGVKQLYPDNSSWIRVALSAFLGSVYGAVCLIPGIGVLATGVFPVLLPVMTALVAFGFGKDTLRRTGAFLLLRLALCGLAVPGGMLRPWTVLLSSVLALLLFLLGLPDGMGGYVPVELRYGTTFLQLTALRDTGNTLRDPVTGRPVLVLGADAAQKLTGLSLHQLRTPVESMQALPGLRLIPYRTVCGSGLLLALRVKNLRVGNWKGSGVVAFAPEVLSLEGKFQALTGGML